MSDFGEPNGRGIGREEPVAPQTRRGTGKGSKVEGGSSGSPSTRILQHWRDVIVDAKFSSNYQATPPAKIFHANVRHLMTKEKLTETELCALVDEFGRRIRSGQINLAGKNAWFVFMRAWPKLVNEVSTGYTGTVDLGEEWQAFER